MSNNKKATSSTSIVFSAFAALLLTTSCMADMDLDENVSQNDGQSDGDDVFPERTTPNETAASAEDEPDIIAIEKRGSFIGEIPDSLTVVATLGLRNQAGRCLTAFGDSARVRPCDNSSSQQFDIYQMDDGTYAICKQNERKFSYNSEEKTVQVGATCLVRDAERECSLFYCPKGSKSGLSFVFMPFSEIDIDNGTQTDTRNQWIYSAGQIAHVDGDSRRVLMEVDGDARVHNETSGQNPALKTWGVYKPE